MISWRTSRGRGRTKNVQNLSFIDMLFIHHAKNEGSSGDAMLNLGSLTSVLRLQLT